MIEPVSSHVDIPSGVSLHTLTWNPPAPANVRPFVLTHGLASNARLWDGVARRLADRGHLVVTVDQRGHGRSSKPDGPYDMATCADDLADLVGLLGFDRPPAVGGQSWGGNVVLELAHRQPEVVDQVICVDGGFIDLGTQFPEWERAAEVLAPPRLLGTPLTTMEGWLAQSAADWPEEGRAGTLANFEVRPDGTIAPWLTFERHLAVLRGLWEHRPSSRYPTLTRPVLFVAADSGDVGWTASKERAVDDAVEAVPTARVHWFRPAHHDVHAQQPDAVADLLHAAVTDPDFYATTHSETRR